MEYRIPPNYNDLRFLFSTSDPIDPGGMDRKVVVYFFTKESESDGQMKGVLSDPSVARVLSRSFVLFSIDQQEHEKLAKFYGCQTAPFVIVFDTKGKVCAFSDKAPDAGKFVRMLRKAAD